MGVARTGQLGDIYSGIRKGREGILQYLSPDCSVLVRANLGRTQVACLAVDGTIGGQTSVKINQSACACPPSRPKWYECQPKIHS